MKYIEMYENYDYVYECILYTFIQLLSEQIPWNDVDLSYTKLQIR